MAPTVRKSWSPTGQTPILRQKTRSHKKISAIGCLAVTTGGRKARMFFRLHEGKSVKAQDCVDFLVQLKQNIKSPILLVWDRLQAHRSKKVANFIESQKRFEQFFLPPYAPELNPIEYFWSHLKWVELANFTPTSQEELYNHTKAAICSIRRDKSKLVSFVRHSPLQFN